MRRSYLLAGVVVSGLVSAASWVAPAGAHPGTQPSIVGDRHVASAAELTLAADADTAATGDTAADDGGTIALTIGTGAAAVAAGFVARLVARGAYGSLRTAVEWWREARFVP